MNTTILARYAELTALLHQYNYDYFVLSQPTISDLNYDRLFDELLEIERNHPDFQQPDSPTKRIGSDLVQQLPEVAHAIPVLSLEKSYTITEILSWVEKNTSSRSLTFTVEEKIDGLAIVLYYRDGKLAQAITRGNGIVGNDITANIQTIRTVPLRLSKPVNVVVRGEIFLPLTEFVRVNEAAEITYANPRNFAAGAVRRVKSSDVASIPLKLVAYEGTFIEDPPSDHATTIDRLQALSFPINNNNELIVPSNQLDKAMNLHPNWAVSSTDDLPLVLQRMTERRSFLDYEIDGAVIKVNSLSARATLGVTGHHPRWAHAFKFQAPKGVTIVQGISVQVGRTGRITPVAKVTPISIAGSTITNITLHNQDYINSLELAIGDQVAISKRGDVIPAIDEVIEKNNQKKTTWLLPSSCPSCGIPIKLIGSHHFCPNQKCADQIRGRIHFFADRSQMDIENLGKKTIDRLIEAGLLMDIEDIFTFDIDLLKEWNGFGERKVELLKHGINKCRNQPFDRVLPALGIPEIGPKTMELLIEAGYNNIDLMISAARAGDSQPLTAISGIGEKTASVIISQLNDTNNLRRINSLRASGLCLSAKLTTEIKKQLFDGQRWCITGTLANFSSRENVAQAIKQSGGQVTGSISSRTTHLLAGKSAGKKLIEAQRLGINIVQEEEFYTLIRKA